MKIIKKTFFLFFVISLFYLVGCSNNKYFTITWINYDDSILDSRIYRENEIPKYDNQLPTHEYSGYLFSGWDQEIKPVKKSMTYKALYTDNIFELKLNEDQNSYTLEALLSNLVIDDFVIPSSYMQIPITVIGESAFSTTRFRLKAKTVTIPQGIIRIEKWAFSMMMVEKFNLPDTLEYIGDYAFANNEALKEFVIPSSVTELGEYVFYANTSLEKVDLGRITVIPTGIFIETALKTLKIPETVTTIKPAGISGTQISSLVIPSNVKIIDRLGVLDNIFLAIIEIESSDIQIGEGAFTMNIELKSCLFAEGITSFPKILFEQCPKLHYVNIPKSLVSIDDEAFMGCVSLEYIYIPKNVLTINKDVFKNCSNLVIYTEHSIKPEGWSENWNNNCQVIWN